MSDGDLLIPVLVIKDNEHKKMFRLMVWLVEKCLKLFIVRIKTMSYNAYESNEQKISD